MIVGMGKMKKGFIAVQGGTFLRLLASGLSRFSNRLLNVTAMRGSLEARAHVDLLVFMPGGDDRTRLRTARVRHGLRNRSAGDAVEMFEGPIHC